jgi:hypothetical protein
MPGLLAGDQYDDLTGAVQQVSSSPLSTLTYIAKMPGRQAETP